MLMMFGCGLAGQIEESDALMESFYTQRANGENVDAYYSALFWQATKKHEWKNLKSVIEKAHGDITSYEQVTWQIKSSVHTNELSGTFVYYRYITHHDIGNVTEYLALFREDDSQEFKIISHRFDSQEIEKLVNKSIQKIATELNNSNISF